MAGYSAVCLEKSLVDLKATTMAATMDVYWADCWAVCSVAMRVVKLVVRSVDWMDETMVVRLVGS